MRFDTPSLVATLPLSSKAYQNHCQFRRAAGSTPANVARCEKIERFCAANRSQILESGTLDLPEPCDPDVLSIRWLEV